jgi:hypothetical protein
MLISLRKKIRSLVEDFLTSDTQVHTYINSNIFTMAENNIQSITSVLINGNPLESGENYSYSPTTKKITFAGVSFSSGDQIEVGYTYYEYSDTELDGFIRASLIWLSIYDYTEGDFELEDTGIYPTLSNKEIDMVAIIASILIKPDCTSYKLEKVSVVYPNLLPKEERIQDLISQFKVGIGAVGVIDWVGSYYDYDIVDYPVFVAVKTETKHEDFSFYRGTKSGLVVEIQDKNSYLVDLTGATLYLTVKENMEDADLTAVISQDLTPANPTTGREIITLSTSETDRVGNFYYDIKLVDSDGYSYILLTGRMKFIESVTKRS